MSEDVLDLNEARRILDRDHYGLERSKRRLIEYLAVRKLNPEGRGPILCFLGPPGVGKTSLGQSIADALGRRFSRMSLGGIRDEAEIRGHRRTYIGSMPGRLSFKSCDVSGREIRSSCRRNRQRLAPIFGAIRRALSSKSLIPGENHSFVDHYLDVPFDLSAGHFHSDRQLHGSGSTCLA